MLIFKKATREQSGADSYNRFEYQISYTFSHLIKNYKKDLKDYIVFCEFHDDFIQSKNNKKFDCIDFFQVKTKNKGSFTYKMLFDKTEGKNHSFMGYIFYNFLNFKEQCNECFFITNLPFDKDLEDWQRAIIEKKDLSKNNSELFNRILNSLKSEFAQIDSKLFIATFNKFINNTYLKVTDLDLKNHDKVVHSDFINLMQFQSVDLAAAQLMHGTIKETIRKKARYKFDSIVSQKRIIEKKSITLDIFEKIENMRDLRDNTYNLFNELPLNVIDINTYKYILKNHYDYKIINSADVLYIELVSDFVVYCEEFIKKNVHLIETANIINYGKQITKEFKGNHPNINNKLLEVLFYETYFRTITFS